MPDTQNPLESDICHLTSAPPEWVAEYIGLPFRDRGRDRSGCDCWGLVRLVLGERYGVELPSHAEGYDGHEDTAAVEALIGGEAAGGWERIPAPEAAAGDVVVLRGVEAPHIGLLVARGVMLHVASQMSDDRGQMTEGGLSELARLSHPTWANRLRPTDAAPYAGFYRCQMPDVRCQTPNKPLASGICHLISGEQQLLAPGEGCWHLTIKPHPFRAGRRRVEIPTGLSLEEAFAQEQPDAVCRLYGAATIVGEPVPLRRQWARIRPKSGVQVTINALPPVPGFGGDTLRVVALIAVAAAAIAAPYLIPGISPLGAAALSAGIAVGGGLLVNALLPVQNRRLDRRVSSADSPTFSIESAQNELRPYQPIPRPLGTHRFVGHLGARTYRQIVNGEVYFRILLIWGYGPLEVSDIKIGETPIEDFDDVQVETRKGYANDDPLTLYSNDVLEEVPGTTLTQAAGFVTRRTRPDTEEIDLDFTFPRGLVWLDEQDGRRKERWCQFMVQYASAGSNDWSADDTPAAIGGAALDLGAPPDGFIRYNPGDDRRQFVIEPVSRWDAVVLDTYSQQISIIAAPESYVRLVREGRPVDDLYYYRAVRPRPQVPFGKLSLAWVKRIAGGETGGIPAERVIDRRSLGDGGRRGARVAFNTSDVLVQTDRIRQPAGVPRWRDNDLLRLDSDGTLPGGLSAGGGLFVVNATASTYQLAASEGGDPIAIADRGSGAHYASDALAAPATDFAVTTAAPTANTVDHAAGSSFWIGLWARAATTSPYRVGLNFQVPKGQYDVRVRRLTADTDDDLIIDEVAWTGLRSIAYVTPFSLAGVAKSAILIRATEQLEGRVEPISALLTSRAKSWDGAAWQDNRRTNNPADLFRLVAQDAANKAPRTDAQLDLPALQAWHDECAAQGWAFNMIVDFRTTVPEMLGMIAAAGMASPAYLDGKWTVVQDVDKTVPVQHITPRNSWGYQGRLRFEKRPEAFRVRYIDEGTWTNAERIVPDDGSTADTAAEILGLEFPGVTDPALIWRHARRRIAEARLRPEEHKVMMDPEHLVAIRGDLCVLAHDAIKVGLGHGRLKAVATGGGGEATGVTLDSAVPMEAGKNYVLRMRDETGASVLAPVDTVAGEQTVLTFTTPIPAPSIAADNLFLFGELGLESREVIITAIRPDADLNAEITMVDLARAVFQADDAAYDFTAAEVDAGANEIDNFDPGFFNGDRVRLDSTGTLPATAPAIAAGQELQVVGADSSVFQLSADLDSDPATAPPLDFVDGGTGTHTASRTIPPFAPGISPDPVLPELGKPAAPVIEEIRTDESVMTLNIDGTYQARIGIRFSVPPTATAPDTLEAQLRETDGDQGWRRAALVLLPADEVLLGEVDQLSTYDLRLRTLTRAGVTSDWVTRLAVLVEGTTAAPPDVTNLLLQPNDLLTWELLNAPFDLAGFRVKWHYGTDQTWATGTLLTPELIKSREISIADLRGGTKTIMVKAVDRYGTESDNAAVLTLDLVLTQDLDLVLDTRDVLGEGLPGALTGADVRNKIFFQTRQLDLAGGNHGLIGGLEEAEYCRGLLGRSALKFPGFDAHVLVGDVLDFTGTAAFTIACRFRVSLPLPVPPTQGVDRYLVAKLAGSDSDGYALWVDGTTGQLCGGRYGSSTETALTGPVLEDQRVYVAAMVYDGSNLRLVLDGTTVAGPTASTQSYVDHSNALLFGRRKLSESPVMLGVIDEVQIWDVARSDVQIAADTAALLFGPALTNAKTAGLVGYWPFEEALTEFFGPLEAYPVDIAWTTDGDDLPAESQEDSGSAWDLIYERVVCDFDYVPPTQALPGDLTRTLEIEGRSVELLMRVETAPAWPQISDDEPAWPDDDDQPAEPAPPEYKSWPTVLSDVTRQRYDFRIVIGQGQRQGRITALSLAINGDLAEPERFEDLEIGVNGRVVPIAQPYRKYTEITATLQDDGGTARSLLLVQKGLRSGPALLARDKDGNNVAATADVIVKGITV